MGFRDVGDGTADRNLPIIPLTLNSCNHFSQLLDDLETRGNEN